MKPETSVHLSEEALNDILIGLGSPEAEAHLAGCEACRSQLHLFQSDMQVFNQASLAWSEAKPRKRLVLPKAKAAPALLPQLAWATASALLLMIGISFWNHEHNLPVPQGPEIAQVQGDTEAQIAQDNDLLRSINAALSEQEISPVREYHLSDEPRPRRRARLGSRSR